MSGLELCWETRLLSGRERPIYIILMSSNSDQQHLINALDSGADEFIRKPPVGEELYARLRSAERLLRLQNELIELASIDPLTHVFNRRAFFDRAQLLCRGASPLAAIMLDVDHFKRINDTYGHDVGDQVLGAIGREFQSENAVVGRLGGEEFAILIGARAAKPRSSMPNSFAPAWPRCRSMSSARRRQSRAASASPSGNRVRASTSFSDVPIPLSMRPKAADATAWSKPGLFSTAAKGECRIWCARPAAAPKMATSRRQPCRKADR
jgi:GGDEF domain-containing protein